MPRYRSNATKSSDSYFNDSKYLRAGPLSIEDFLWAKSDRFTLDVDHRDGSILMTVRRRVSKRPGG